MNSGTQLLNNPKGQGSNYATEFENNSLQNKFEDFMNTCSKFRDQSITLKKNYASCYFGKEGYETALFYNCLQVPEKYRSGKKIHDFKALSYFKVTLIDFIKAFKVILETDFHQSIEHHITAMENFKLQLQTLITLIPDSIIDVPESFSKKEIEKVTEIYIDRLDGKQMLDVCPGLTKAGCKTRLMGFTVVAQFCIFLCLLNKCLRDLFPLLPH